MTYGNIEQAVNDFINGNLSDSRRRVNKMSKLDLLEYVEYLAQNYQGMMEKDYFGYGVALTIAKEQLRK